MLDRAAERPSLLRTLRIDMDPLMIAGRVRGVDLVCVTSCQSLSPMCSPRDP